MVCIINVAMITMCTGGREFTIMSFQGESDSRVGQTRFFPPSSPPRIPSSSMVLCFFFVPFCYKIWKTTHRQHGYIIRRVFLKKNLRSNTVFLSSLLRESSKNWKCGKSWTITVENFLARDGGRKTRMWVNDPETARVHTSGGKWVVVTASSTFECVETIRKENFDKTGRQCEEKISESAVNYNFD